MGLSSFLNVRRRGRTVNNLAAEVAVRSHRAVWQTVGARAQAMRFNEARGYTRIRARRILQQHAECLLANLGIADEQLTDQVVISAAEQVITMVMRELLHIPAQIHNQRRAA